LIQQLLLLIAPLLATALIVGAEAAAALWTAAAATLFGTVAFVHYVLVDRAAPPGHRTEAFTWLSTALAVGGAGGSALAGLAADRLGVVPAVLLPTPAAGAAAAIASRSGTRRW
jgi:predicted MFS family arabinose efflux permease